MDLELLESLEKDLSASDEEVILCFVNKDIEACKNKNLLIILNKIKRELSKPRADKTPQFMWIEETGSLGSFPYSMSMENYYYLFYYDLKQRMKSHLSNAEELFKFNWDFSVKSKFHNHNMKLKEVLLTRKDKIKILKEMANERNKTN